MEVYRTEYPMEESIFEVAAMDAVHTTRGLITQFKAEVLRVPAWYGLVAMVCRSSRKE